ncbi:hypothetical protein ES703_103700 [subsurface metagenome]
MLPNIAFSESPEYCINNSVYQDICIRIAEEAFIIWNGHTPQDERLSFNEPMNIVTKTNPESLFDHFSLLRKILVSDSGIIRQ